VIKFGELLQTYHGKIDKILITYDDTGCGDTSKLSKEEYEKWDKHVNKEFDIVIDLLHSGQKLESFKELKPYLELRVDVWLMFTENNKTVLEVEVV